MAEKNSQLPDNRPAIEASYAARRSLGVREARRVDGQIRSIWRLLLEFGLADVHANWNDDPSPLVRAAFERLGAKL